MSTITRRLQGWRKDRGLAQRAAARLAGISQAAWCQCESGERIPTDLAIVGALVRVTGDNPRFALTFDMFLRELARRRKGRAQAGERATGTDD